MKTFFLMLFFCFSLTELSFSQIAEGIEPWASNGEAGNKSAVENFAGPGKEHMVKINSSGSFNYTLPIAKVKGRGGLDFDLQLNYTPDVKVIQDAGWVGAGWSLPIGKIVRTNIIRTDLNPIKKEQITPDSDGNVFDEYYDGHRDFFDISFPEGSARIIQVPKSNTADESDTTSYMFVTEEYHPWKIEYDEIYHRFIITTESGTRYIFGSVDQSAQLIKVESNVLKHPGKIRDEKYNVEGFNDELPLRSVYHNYFGEWLLTAILSYDYIDGGGDKYTPCDANTNFNCGNWIVFNYRVDGFEDKKVTYNYAGSPDLGVATLLAQICEDTYLSEILTPVSKCLISLENEERNSIFENSFYVDFHSQCNEWLKANATSINSYNDSEYWSNSIVSKKVKKRINSIRVIPNHSNKPSYYVSFEYFKASEGDGIYNHRSFLKTLYVGLNSDQKKYQFKYYDFGDIKNSDGTNVRQPNYAQIFYQRTDEGLCTGFGGYYCSKFNSGPTPRDVDGKLFLLSTITYPEGLLQVFNYATNFCQLGFNPDVTGGKGYGARLIEQKVIIDSETSNSIKYEYIDNYGQNPHGKAKFYLDPIAAYALICSNDFGYGNIGTKAGRTILNNQVGKRVIYPEIKEIDGNGAYILNKYSFPNLSTLSELTANPAFSDIISHFSPGSAILAMMDATVLKSGKLISQEKFTPDNKPVYKIDYQYEFAPKPFSPGKYYISIVFGEHAPMTLSYYLKNKKVIEKYYDLNSGQYVSNTTEIEVNPENMQPSIITKKYFGVADDKIEKQVYKYAFEIYPGLKSANLLKFVAQESYLDMVGSSVTVVKSLATTYSNYLSYDNNGVKVAPIWRKHRVAGLSAKKLTSIPEVNFWGSDDGNGHILPAENISSNNWALLSEIRNYDAYGNVLASTDYKELYANRFSGKVDEFYYGYDNSQIIATYENPNSSNTPGEFVGFNFIHCGFENGNIESNIDYPIDGLYFIANYPGKFNSKFSHSGFLSLEIDQEIGELFPSFFIFPLAGNDQKLKYEISFWYRTNPGFNNPRSYVNIMTTKNKNELVTPYPNIGGSDPRIPLTDTGGKWEKFSQIIDLQEIRTAGGIADNERLGIKVHFANGDPGHKYYIDDFSIYPVVGKREQFTYDLTNGKINSYTDNNSILRKMKYLSDAYPYEEYYQSDIVIKESGRFFPNTQFLNAEQTPHQYTAIFPFGNYVHNSGFEETNNGFFVGINDVVGIKWSIDKGFTGRNSLRLYSDQGTGYFSTQLKADVKLKPGTSYIISFRAKVNNSSSFSLPVSLVTGNDCEAIGSVQVAGANWKYYSLYLTPGVSQEWQNPQNTTVIKFTLPQTGLDVSFDNLVATEYNGQPEVLIEKDYFNTFGNHIQNIKVGKNTDIVSNFVFDAFGRPIQSWKPYSRISGTLGFLDLGYESNCYSFYNLNPENKNGVLLFSENIYSDDGTERIISERQIGDLVHKKSTVDYSLTAGRNGKVYNSQVSTDQDGIKVRRLTDGKNQVYSITEGFGSSTERTTEYEYFSSGKIKRIIHPNGTFTEFEYDNNTNLISLETPNTNAPYTTGSESDITINPDYKTYISNGNKLRFQYSPNNYSSPIYNKYDLFGRNIESGKVSLSISAAETKKNELDWPVSADAPVILTKSFYDISGTIDGYSIANSIGKLSKQIEFISGATGITNLAKTTWYSYNPVGLISEINQELNNLKISEKIEKYDLLGNPLTIKYYLNNNLTLGTWVEMDEFGRISKTFIGNSENKPVAPQQTFYYNADGSINKVTWGTENQLSKELVYLLNGSLSSITQKNNQNTTVFNQRLFYSNAPSGITPLYNGRISFTDEYLLDQSYTTKRMAYCSLYDNLGQLIETKTYLPNGSNFVLDPLNIYNTAYSYDLMGNVSTLKRNNTSQIDNLQYTYSGNRILSVLDNALSSDGYTDGGLIVFKDDFESGSTGQSIVSNGFWTITATNNCSFLVSSAGNTTSKKAMISVATATGNQPNTYGEATSAERKIFPGFKYKISADTWCTGYEAYLVIEFLDGAKATVSSNSISFMKYSYGFKTLTVTAPANATFARIKLRMKNEGYPTSASFDNLKLEPVYSQTYTSSFDYDGNGNLTRDLNRGITSIVYNFQNMPVKITKGDNSIIEYGYDCSGNRIFKKTGTTLTNFYLGMPDGNFLGELVNSAAAPVKTTGNLGISFNHSALTGTLYLYSVNNIGSNGRKIISTTGDYQQFIVSDYLGNNRLVLSGTSTPGPNTKIDSYEFFYPYGATLVSSNSSVPENAKYKYQGNERDSETGYDNFNNRYYDAQLIRFLQVDPMAVKYANSSPYIAMGNNPVSMVDPEGTDFYQNTRTGQYGFAENRTSQSLVDENGDVWTRVDQNWIIVDGYVFFLRDMLNGDWREKGLWIPPANKLTQYVEAYTIEDVVEMLKRADLQKSEAISTVEFDPIDLALVLPAAGKLTFLTVKSVATGFFKASSKSLFRASVDAAAKGVLRSFDDVVANPKALWGKSADEVGSMLGDGWTKGAYGSSKTGWKFTRSTDGQSIFYHPGGGRHGGSYYGFSSGTLGKTKIVGPDYIPLKGDKATIINIDN